MGVGASLYTYDVVVKSSRSLSHLLVSFLYLFTMQGICIESVTVTFWKHNRLIWAYPLHDSGEFLDVRYMLSPVRLSSVCL